MRVLQLSSGGKRARRSVLTPPAQQVPAPSASALYNNLCPLSGGGAAYIHKRQVKLLRVPFGALE